MTSTLLGGALFSCRNGTGFWRVERCAFALLRFVDSLLRNALSCCTCSRPYLFDVCCLFGGCSFCGVGSSCWRTGSLSWKRSVVWCMLWRMILRSCLKHHYFWGDKPCAPPKLKDAKAIAVEPEELRLTTSNCSRLVAHFFANLARSAFFAPETMSSRERVIILVFRKDLLWRDDWKIDIFACTVAA